MTEYSTRFDEGVNQLRDDGVDVAALEPILGWFFLQMAGLRVTRVQMEEVQVEGVKVEEVQVTEVKVQKEQEVSHKVGL